MGISFTGWWNKVWRKTPFDDGDLQFYFVCTKVSLCIIFLIWSLFFNVYQMEFNNDHQLYTKLSQGGLGVVALRDGVAGLGWKSMEWGFCSEVRGDGDLGVTCESGRLLPQVSRWQVSGSQRKTLYSCLMARRRGVTQWGPKPFTWYTPGWESTIMLSGSSQGESSVLRVRLRVVKNPLWICTRPLWICISRSKFALVEVQYTLLPPSAYS